MKLDATKADDPRASCALFDATPCPKGSGGSVEIVSPSSRELPPLIYHVSKVPTASELALGDAKIPVRLVHNATQLIGRGDPQQGFILLDLDDNHDFSEQVLQMLSGEAIAAPLIVIGSNPTVVTAVRWMKAGAADFLPKPVSGQALMTSLLDAWSKYVATLACDPKARLDALTFRQRAVLEYMSQGATNRDIGKKLGISTRTVEMHRRRLKKSLGVSSSAEVISMAAAARSPRQMYPA